MSTKVTNTTTQGLASQLGWILGGNPNAIEAQESAGQNELVASSQLPAEGIEKVLTMGIQVVGPTDGDPIFVDVKLPVGWSKTATDHAMWSNLVDDKGRPRASIFYKAAFYDRSAHIYPTQRYNYGSQPVGGYSDDYDRLAPYEGYVRDASTDKIIWTSPPFECDANESWKCHEDASIAAKTWIETQYPDYDNILAYWD